MIGSIQLPTVVVGAAFAGVDFRLLLRFVAFGSLNVNSKVPPIARVCGEENGELAKSINAKTDANASRGTLVF